MADKHCATECREELLTKIGGKVCRSTMWKFTMAIVSVVIAVGGILYSSYAGGIDKREEQTQKLVAKQELALENVARAVQDNTISITAMKGTLGTLQEGQSKLEHKMDEQTRMIMQELRKR